MIYLIDECYFRLRHSRRDLVFNYFNKLDALMDSGVELYDEDSEVGDGDSLLIGVFGNPCSKSGYVTEWSSKMIDHALNRFQAKNIFVIVEDMHTWSYDFKKLKKFIKKKNVILTYNECEEAEFFKKNANCHWVPHHIDLSIFRCAVPFEERLKPFFLYGNVNPGNYPDRVKTYESVKDRCMRVEHPGYFMMQNGIFQKDLARYLNNVERAIVCPSKYNYAVAKYFEIAACGAIPFGTSCSDIQKIGLKVTLSEGDGAGLVEHNLGIVKNYGLDQYVEKIKCLIGNS